MTIILTILFNIICGYIATLEILMFGDELIGLFVNKSAYLDSASIHTWIWVILTGSYPLTFVICFVHSIFLLFKKNHRATFFAFIPLIHISFIYAFLKFSVGKF